ncbi:MAG: right-handed parallel beta-helix repeat-containing protein [Phycisphaerales bacterium]|nr:right-handed parallel beta-helix repeat-containing protein [Phycisphaerales bacterium]
MSIRSAGGPANCIIDCENDGLGFTFCTLPDDRPVTIEGFTIRDGRGVFAGGICIAAAEVTIDNCVIEQCVGTGDGITHFSGGLMIFQSPVLITNTIIRGNFAGSYRGATGAGIHAYGYSDLTIEDTRIEDNEAAGPAGGGAYIDRNSRLVMRRCSVSGNHLASPDYRGVGGGIYAGAYVKGSSITETDISANWISTDDPEDTSFGGGAYLTYYCDISNCSVTGNRANNGGGIFFDSDRVKLRDILIADNYASLDGGGCYSEGNGYETIERVRLLRNSAGRDGGGAFSYQTQQWSHGEIAGNTAERNGGGLYGLAVGVRQCRILDNRSGQDGAGIYTEFGAVVSSTLIAGNRAEGSGGGVFERDSDGYSRNVTVVANSSRTGGGGVHIEGAGHSDPAMFGSIVFGNSPTSIADASGMLIVEHCNVEGGWPGVGNLDVDPRFIDPANDDYRLGPASPCIDSGDNRQVDEGKDLAGLPRRMDDRGMPDAGIGLNAIVDMGCYEFQGTSTGFIAVHPRPGVAGRDNQLQAAGATPGNVVYFVYGFATGSTGVPGCPGLTIDIANPRIAAQSTADANGYASKIINIPSAASGRAIILQAVDRDACAVSNAIGYRFP